MRSGGLSGPGLAFDGTARLKDGDATACAAPQHAGSHGHVGNCVTGMFAAYVAASGRPGRTDVFMPGGGEGPGAAPGRGIPRVDRAAELQLAIGQLERL